MVRNLEELVLGMQKLQQQLDTPYCRHRKEKHDSYLAGVRFLACKNEAEFYWDMVEWYDAYFCRQAKIQQP